MHKKYDALFWEFEENEFEYEHRYPRNTELVFQFWDYIYFMSIDELMEKLNCSRRWAKIAKRVMLNGCDRWLKE